MIQILQIYRDFLKPGTDSAYRENEEEAARICARLECPNPYLTIESLSGPQEFWYLNGYQSTSHQTAVAEGYRRNVPLMTALNTIAGRKSGLILAPLDIITRYRADLTSGSPWRIGEGRFLVITVTRRYGHAEGTVFEAEDGTLFIIRSARSRDEADARATAAGVDTRVFAVRPSLSTASRDWMTSDPEFWQPQAR
ncbi:MAG: hypothetical protein ACRD1Q_10055 [Vicinamibacterales bacterium]